MGCPDDNVLGAYLAHTLTGPERARVDEHLSSCDNCLMITCAAARDQDATAPAERERIGRYVLIEMLGRGGMGTVYLAYDPQLDRKVALKVVRSQRFEQADVRARLSREARAMAQVRHPNVVAVYDAGDTDGGVFIAMELVEGETLARWLAARPRTWREIVRVFAAAGAGVAAAHAAGIVHRDFKPENVLVDRDGRVAVTDFGLAVVPETLVAATAVGDIDLEATNVRTQAGTVLGTPRYMSPEQFRGVATDAATDQFSFAVALYHALYGAAPFEGATIEQLARAVTSGKLRARPGGTRVPRRIHHVVVRALAPSSDARFPSMAALLAAIDGSSRPRWRIPAVVLAGAATAAIAVRVWPHLATIPAIKPQPVRSAGSPRLALFVEKFKNRTGDPLLDDTLDVTVASVLYSSTQIDPFAGAELSGLAQQVQGDAANVDALVDKVAAPGQSIILSHGSVERRGLGFVVSLDARIRGSTQPRFTASRSAARLDDVLPVTKRLAADMLESLGDPPVPPSALHVLSSSLGAIHAWVEGQRHAITGDQRGAIAGFQHAVELDPSFAEARSSLGLSLYDVSDRPDAIAELERAFQAADTIPERQRLTLIGDYYGTVGRYSESIMAYQQLLAKWPGDSRTQINLTATALDANSWPLALEAARDAAVKHGNFEVVRRNLVIAELGNELLPEALADAKELTATGQEASAAGISLLSDVLVLLGHPSDAHAALAQLANVDPELAPRANADLALYEGRLDDALVALAGRTSADDQIILARVLERRGDRKGELVAATAAATATAANGDVLPDAYLAASLVIDAGATTGVADKARVWSGAPESDRRMYGKLLAGDLAFADHRPRDAIAAYEDAARVLPSWIVHERLARAQLAAGANDDAQRELAWCLGHRGQAAMMSNPSLELLPEVYLELARTKDAAKAPPDDVRAAYQAVADLAPAAQHDPWTDEVRRRLAALPR